MVHHRTGTFALIAGLAVAVLGMSAPATEREDRDPPGVASVEVPQAMEFSAEHLADVAQAQYAAVEFDCPAHDHSGPTDAVTLEGHPSVSGRPGLGNDVDNAYVNDSEGLNALTRALYESVVHAHQLQKVPPGRSWY